MADKFSFREITLQYWKTDLVACFPVSKWLVACRIAFVFVEYFSGFEKLVCLFSAVKIVSACRIILSSWNILVVLKNWFACSPLSK